MESKELSVGDKIRIVCKDGHSSSAEIYHGDKRLDFITSIFMEIKTNELVKAKVELITPIIDLDNVEISEIIDSNPKIAKIQKILGEYCCQHIEVREPSPHDFLMQIEQVLING